MAFEDFYIVFAVFFVVSGLFATGGAGKIYSDWSVKMEVKTWFFENLAISQRYNFFSSEILLFSRA